MKTLQSILNSPERRLSAEEMKEVKGGDAYCKCFWSDAETGELVDFQSVHITGGDCGSASARLSYYYHEIFDVTCI